MDLAIPRYFHSMKSLLHILILLQVLLSIGANAQDSTFTNPLLPSGADPWITWHDGYYYYTNTLGNRITIWRTQTITALSTAEKKVIFTPPPNTSYSKELWAPEIHFMNYKWYVYFAADDGQNKNHRMYVLENKSKDPFQGKWILKGKVADAEDKWAIDGSVFKYRKRIYMVWSGWEGNSNGRQDIYIAKMKKPWRIRGKRVRISSPTYDWETHGTLNDASNPPHVAVNEGPQILEHDHKLFLVFSASGCWTDDYSLGLLSFNGNNILDSASWEKSPTPLFKTSIENKVYAPGHNSFFKSPDGKQDWILYHANPEPGQGCGRFRSPRAQPFHWNENGLPVLGAPLNTGVPIKLPQ